MASGPARWNPGRAKRRTSSVASARLDTRPYTTATDHFSTVCFVESHEAAEVDGPIEVLITVKASPEIGRTHGETVCVAGIRTDLATPQWIRLFPVQWKWFWGKQHPKYQVLSIEVACHAKDKRPESHRPDLDSAEVIRQLGLGEPRSTILNRLPQPTMCGLLSQKGWARTSLAMVVPSEVLEVTCEDNTGDESHESKMRMAAQGSLFAQNAPTLELCPYTFRYRYRCLAPECSGHHQSIADWEISEAWRRWKVDYPSDFLERIRDKWMALVAPDRHPAFFVGNQHQAPQGFMVLGVARDVTPREPPVGDQNQPGGQSPSSDDTREAPPQNTSPRLFEI